jgi:hypothetical protein
MVLVTTAMGATAPSHAAEGGLSVSGVASSPARASGTIGFAGTVTVPEGIYLTFDYDSGEAYRGEFNNRIHARHPDTHRVVYTCPIPDTDVRPDLDVGYYTPKPGTHSVDCRFAAPVGVGQPTAYDWTFDYAILYPQDVTRMWTIVLGRSEVLQPVSVAYATTADLSVLKGPGIVTLGLTANWTWTDNITTPYKAPCLVNGRRSCRLFSRAPQASEMTALRKLSDSTVRQLVQQTTVFQIRFGSSPASTVTVHVNRPAR